MGLRGRVVSCRLRRELDGASAVEFAILLPVLLVLIFGTIYGAALYNSQQTLTHAAREGARFAATLPREAFPSDAAWQGEVVNRAAGVLDTDRPISPGEVSICVRFYEEAGGSFDNGATACPAPSTPGGMQGPRVEVSATRGSSLELGVRSIPLTLSASAVARYEPEIDG
jgi:Flp pilus assembly pilin Flp